MTVEYQFVGLIVSNPSSDPVRFPFGSNVHLTLSVPTNAVDLDTDPQIGDYEDALSLHLTNDNSATTAVSVDCDGDLLVLNDFQSMPGLPLQDLLTAGGTSCDTPIGSVALSLNNTGATAFGSDAIPSSPIDLSAFDTTSITITVDEVFFPVFGIVTAVPEPSSSAAAAAATIVLVSLCNSRRRKPPIRR